MALNAEDVVNEVVDNLVEKLITKTEQIERVRASNYSLKEQLTKISEVLAIKKQDLDRQTIFTNRERELKENLISEIESLISVVENDVRGVIEINHIVNNLQKIIEVNNE